MTSQLSRLFAAAITVAVSSTVAPAQTPAQPEDRYLEISIGEKVIVKKGRLADYAGHYAHYAVLAANAYRDYVPDGKNGFAEVQPFDADTYGKQAEYAKRLIESWKVVDSKSGYVPCPNGVGQCLNSSVWASGLNYHILTDSNSVCRKIIVAFRGTDSAIDFVSNFRGLHGSWVKDEYDQVRRDIEAMMKKIVDNPCYRTSTKIIAVGHSLGGGLAQFAAFLNRKIRQVVIFNSSPVTGENDLVPKDVLAIKKGLSIDHVYNRGEALYYARSYYNRGTLRSACDPQIRTIVVDEGPTGIFARHRIGNIAQSMLEWSPEEERTRRPKYTVTRLPIATAADRRNCTAAIPEEEPLDDFAPSPWVTSDPPSSRSAGQNSPLGQHAMAQRQRRMTVAGR